MTFCIAAGAVRAVALHIRTKYCAIILAAHRHIIPVCAGIVEVKWPGEIRALHRLFDVAQAGVGVAVLGRRIAVVDTRQSVWIKTESICIITAIAQALQTAAIENSVRVAISGQVKGYARAISGAARIQAAVAVVCAYPRARVEIRAVAAVYYRARLAQAIAITISIAVAVVQARPARVIHSDAGIAWNIRARGALASSIAVLGRMITVIDACHRRRIIIRRIRAAGYQTPIGAQATSAITVLRRGIAVIYTCLIIRIPP